MMIEQCKHAFTEWPGTPYYHTYFCVKPKNHGGEHAYWKLHDLTDLDLWYREAEMKRLAEILYL